MATIGDVLTHLVAASPGLSDENRTEYLAAVQAAYPAPEPALAQAEADVAAAEAELEAAKAATSGVIN